MTKARKLLAMSNRGKDLDKLYYAMWEIEYRALYLEYSGGRWALYIRKLHYPVVINRGTARALLERMA